jgi:uncharacterized protein (DUF1015 family)
MTKAGETGHAFGLVLPEAFYALTLKDAGAMDLVLKGEFSKAYRQLDVSILHTLILDTLLGITSESLAKEKNLTYVRGWASAVEAVQTHKAQMAFLLNPTKVSEVAEVASQGERMPQKSTDFYPKLLSGFTVYKME